MKGPYTTPGCRRDGAMLLLQLWLRVVAGSPVCRGPNTVRCDQYKSREWTEFY